MYHGKYILCTVIILILTGLSVPVLAKTKNADNQFLVHNEIPYGTDKMQQLDVYAPPERTAPTKPVIIFVHGGGGWQSGDKKEAANHGKFYMEHNIVFVAINYRLSPKDKHPAQAQDTAQAVKWVFDNIEKYGGDKNNIHLIGHSAGAHLVALIGTSPEYLGAHGLSPDMLSSVMPIDTLGFDLTMPIERTVKSKIIETFGKSRKELNAASPITYVRAHKNLPHFVLFVTTKRPDAIKQTIEFFRALRDSGAKTEIKVIKDYSHYQMNLGLSNSNSPICKKVLDTIEHTL